jgi:isopropylmalate/homocitrate/citramalate synthase
MAMHQTEKYLDLSISLKEEHDRLTRILGRLESGKCWTSDTPGRATPDEVDAQIQQIKRVLSELERMIDSSS